jgi:hypothetical protein
MTDLNIFSEKQFSDNTLISKALYSAKMQSKRLIGLLKWDNRRIYDLLVRNAFVTNFEHEPPNNCCAHLMNVKRKSRLLCFLNPSDSRDPHRRHPPKVPLFTGFFANGTWIEHRCHEEVIVS